ncbi:20105_t:CDS:2 [Cetraspora pellucida]|uniref:20105_t:CDS:1 n=1 Tax=Cetraspora pellucida TaxID=1433469 RepID=A0A9N9NSS6_9GLOM|nr:20105_t:CDS:2 [Cetraspora pellucida]
MGKQGHNFKEFFHLAEPNNSKTALFLTKRNYVEVILEIVQTLKQKTNSPKRQTSVNKYVTCLLSEKDKPYFENLLPNQQAISNQILPMYLKKLAKDILQYASEDKIEVIAAFNS